MTAVPARAEPPIFVVAAERSGTTMLELMLAGHSHIAWAGEFEYAIDLVPDEHGWPDVVPYRTYLETDRMFQASRFEVDRTLAYPELVDSFLAQALARARKPLVGATVHRNFPRLLRLWPRARFVHLVRDGRAVARSRIEMGWEGNPWTAGLTWRAAEEQWDALAATLAREQRHEMHYEELVRDPRTTLAALCRFLDLEYEDALLEYPSRSTYARPDARNADQWRTKLTPRELALAEAAMGRMLVARGYALAAESPIEVTPRLERALRRQDRWFRMRFRQREFGYALWLQDVLSRRLRLRGLERAARRRMNGIETTRLK